MPTSTNPLLLALQAADAPARPGAAAPAATTAAPGAPAGAAPAGGAQPASGSAFMVMMLVLLGVMVAFSVVNARRDKKKRESLLASIKKHDKVLTIGGVMGTVVEVKEDVVVLKVDETSNTRITFTKGSISQVTPT